MVDQTHGLLKNITEIKKNGSSYHSSRPLYYNFFKKQETRAMVADQALGLLKK